MERIGHVWRVRPGCAEAYDRAHAEIWPELTRLFHDAGVHGYHIYRWGEILFSHIDVEDYERVVARFSGDPVSERWEEHMADLVEYTAGADPGGWPERIHHVWSLLPGRPSGEE